MLYLPHPATPAGPEDRRRPTARASFSLPRTTRRPIQNAFQERAKWREVGERTDDLLSTTNHAPSRFGLSSFPPPPNRLNLLALRRVGGPAQRRNLFRSESSNLHHGANLSVQGHQFPLRGSFRARGEGTAMLKGAAAFAAPASGSTRRGGTPAERNLPPAPRD